MIHLITGGSGSGKSEYAEHMLCRYRNSPKERLIYIATMFPYDEEARGKVRRHRQMRRGKGFETVECYTGLRSIAGMLEREEPVSVLIECISNLVANELFPPDRSGRLSDCSEDGQEEAAAPGSAADRIMAGVEAIGGIAANVVIVTNEVNSEGLSYGPEMIRYKQVMGEVNCRLARFADRVTEVVYGNAVEVKNSV